MTGLEIYWKERLKQGKYVVENIKIMLQKAYYVDGAITEDQYNELVTYAEEHADPNYKPNVTLESLQQENMALRQTTEEQSQVIDEIMFNIIPTLIGE